MAQREIENFTRHVVRGRVRLNKGEAGSAYRVKGEKKEMDRDRGFRENRDKEVVTDRQTSIRTRIDLDN